MKTIPSFNEFLHLKEQTKIEEKNSQTNQLSDIGAEDVKGFEKIETCKLSIEQSKKSLEKLKSLITAGVKEKSVMENYLQLLEHRNRLIKEYNGLLNEKKQSLKR